MELVDGCLCQAMGITLSEDFVGLFSFSLVCFFYYLFHKILFYFISFILIYERYGTYSFTLKMPAVSGTYTMVHLYSTDGTHDDIVLQFTGIPFYLYFLIFFIFIYFYFYYLLIINITIRNQLTVCLHLLLGQQHLQSSWNFPSCF